jgi:hypothetical protein
MALNCCVDLAISTQKHRLQLGVGCQEKRITFGPCQRKKEKAKVMPSKRPQLFCALQELQCKKAQEVILGFLVRPVFRAWVLVLLE